jgi:3-deoxy-manno-octulosonate cytidylyltransferase (CMP-KDO synthetase)
MADNVVVIIPARYGSSRLPGKALADIAGVPMIVRVYDCARAIPGVDEVLVATDDRRIAAAIDRVRGRVVMTRADHRTGTDRIAEAAQQIDAAIVVNVQGDLPFLDPHLVLPMIRALRDDPQLPMATVMRPLHDGAQWEDPNVVKVVTDRSGHALYFSRRPIPAGALLRRGDATIADEMPAASATAMHHIGLYAYRRAFLSVFAALAPTPLERAEGLEQLRALEHGYRIAVAPWLGPPVLEVNTAADLETARACAGSSSGVGWEDIGTEAKVTR